MSGAAAPTALLLVAHGERRPGATNAGVRRLADVLRAMRLVDEVRPAFLSGEPSVAAALAGLEGARVLVYPLFLADGYFSQVRLPELIAAAPARPRAIEVMPPLGLDPALPKFVADIARRAAARIGFAQSETALVLLAHGSTKSAASREATVSLAKRVERLAGLAAVRTAFLEEPPALSEAVAGVGGPALVIGLFAGDGKHGGGDAPRLVADLDCEQVAFLGNLGGEAELAPLIANAVTARLAFAEASTDASASV